MKYIIRIINRLSSLKVAIVILLLIALGYLRFSGGFDPNTKYSPAKYEDGELKPAENKWKYLLNQF